MMIRVFSAIVACGACAVAGLAAGLWIAAKIYGLRWWLYPWLIVAMLFTAILQFWAGWQ